jgi:hypothetical protein
VTRPEAAADDAAEAGLPGHLGIEVNINPITRGVRVPVGLILVESLGDCRQGLARRMSGCRRLLAGLRLACRPAADEECEERLFDELTLLVLAAQSDGNRLARTLVSDVLDGGRGRDDVARTALSCHSASAQDQMFFSTSSQ